MSVLGETLRGSRVDDERDDVGGHWLEAARPHEHRHELLPMRLRVGLEAAGLQYFLYILIYRIISNIFKSGSHCASGIVAPACNRILTMQLGQPMR